MKRRALLVDDETRVVDALQRALRPHRQTLEIVTATSGKDALALLQTSAFDAVVTDMRMPGMDGAELLGAVREQRPEALRVVLSGQTDLEAALRAIPVAHQFLAKPTEPSVLHQLLTRCLDVKSSLAGIDSLPSPLSCCRELARALVCDEPSSEAIARIIERDPAMTAKIIQTVSTSFFGVRRGICSVADAVSCLGPELVQRLCIAGGLMNPAPVASPSFDIDAHQTRAHAVATLARTIAGGGPDGDVAFVVGTLHDIGSLIAAVEQPTAYDAAPGDLQAHVPNADYLLRLWGLPEPIVHAVVEQATAAEPSGVAGAVRAARRRVEAMGAAA